jgi:hypothetical protein
LRVSQRLPARYPAGTTRHRMEICHHWKNERVDAVVSGHNNEIAVSARQQIDHLSDIALRDWPRCRYSIAEDARDALRLR